MPRKTRPAGPTSKSTTLTGRLKPEETPAAETAAMMVEGLAMNAVTSMGYSQTLGALDLTECMVALVQEARKIQGGNLASLEQMLAAQAVTLNAMFTQLAYQTSNMTIVDQIDRFTRLALKAQGQCRATVEALAQIKNPPATLFARQANIAAGPQQVNNEVSPAALVSSSNNSETEPTKLLEAPRERMDVGTAGAASGGHQNVAPVDTFNRTAKRSR